MKLLYRVAGEGVFSSGRRIFNLSVIFITLALILSACSLDIDSVQDVTAADDPNIPQLTDLNDIEALKVLFNQDTGKPRIILLLSPT